MKGWEEISGELMEAYYTDIDEIRLGTDKPAIANVLKELISQFKEVYEIEDDTDDEDYETDFVIAVRDIRELIRVLEK